MEIKVYRLRIKQHEIKQQLNFFFSAPVKNYIKFPQANWGEQKNALTVKVSLVKTDPK